MKFGIIIVLIISCYELAMLQTGNKVLAGKIILEPNNNSKIFLFLLILFFVVLLFISRDKKDTQNKGKK